MDFLISKEDDLKSSLINNNSNITGNYSDENNSLLYMKNKTNKLNDNLKLSDDNSIFTLKKKAEKRNNSSQPFLERHKNRLCLSYGEKENKKKRELSTENYNKYYNNKEENNMHLINKYDSSSCNKKESQKSVESDLKSIESNIKNTANNEPFKKQLISKNKNFNKINGKRNIIDDFELQTKYGFANIGNSCYMNSFLQILFHTPGFLKTLKKTKKERNLDVNLINNLINLSEDPTNTKYLKNIKHLMGEVDTSFGDYCQNDSQEFGVELLDKIISLIKGKSSFDEEKEKDLEITDENQKEISNELFKQYKEKYFNEEICLEKMFQFHESTIIRLFEENDIKKITNYEFNTYLSVDLSIPANQNNNNINLKDLLKNKYLYSLDKNIDTEEKDNLSEINQEKEEKSCFINFIYNVKLLFKCFFSFTCNCFSFGRSNNDSKINNINLKQQNYICTTKFASLPQILILNINRAMQGKPLYDNIINFEETLDVKEFIDKNIILDKSTKYELYAINECNGNSPNSGHCYSSIKIKGNWYKFNDNIVTKIKSFNLYSQYVVGLFYIKKK